MKKPLLVFLMVVIGVSLFAIDTRKKMEISVAVWDVQSAFSDPNDAVLKYVQDKFNVVFKPVAMTWDDFGQKIRIWAASGDMPDMVAGDVDAAEFRKMVKQGVFRAVPKDLRDYPHIQANLTESDVAPRAIDGVFYEIPRMAATESLHGFGADSTIIARKDWLKKAGITSTPTTFEEFIAVGKALSDKRNGVFGLTCAGANKSGNLFAPETPGLGDWIQVDGKWVPAIMDKRFIGSLQQVSRLLKEDVLDPDVFMLPDKAGIDKFCQGKVGMVVFNGGPSHLKQIYDRWVTYPSNPDFGEAVVQLPWWKNSDGKTYYKQSTNYWSSNYFSTKVDDAKMDRILSIIEFFSTTDGYDLVLYGLPGVDYKKSGDKYTITRAKESDGRFVSIGKKYPSVGSMFNYLANWTADLTMWRDDAANAAAYGPALDVALDSWRWRKQHNTVWPINWKIFFLTSVPNKDKYSSFSNNAVAYQDAVKVILGGGDISSAWNKVLARYRAQDLDKIINAVNAAIK